MHGTTPAGGRTPNDRDALSFQEKMRGPRCGGGGAQAPAAAWAKGPGEREMEAGLRRESERERRGKGRDDDAASSPSSCPRPFGPPRLRRQQRNFITQRNPVLHLRGSEY